MSFWSRITGTTDQDEQNAQLEAKKRAFEEALRRRQTAGTISDEDAQKQREYLDSVALDDTDNAAYEGFKEGAKEGLDNVLNFPGKVVGGVGSGASQLLGGVLKNIPWWVYLGGAVALFVWMGGLSLLRGRFAK